MEGLLGQLGIDWKLLLSQAVNFFILLVILRLFVYKPLFSIIKERNRKIQEGLDKAKEADIRLGEVDRIAAAQLKNAEQESVKIIENSKQNGKIMEQMMHNQVEVQAKRTDEPG
jgi:F-type H+-transporting ATPase subunit b